MTLQSNLNRKEREDQQMFALMGNICDSLESRMGNYCVGEKHSESIVAYHHVASL